jgi:DNA-binding NarL/FixJ family response regulator
MIQESACGRVLIADDHPLFREALRQVVALTLPDHDIAEAQSLDEAMAIAAGDGLDLILLDINMPGMNGFSGLIALRNHVPATPVVVISADESRETIRQAMTLGASGFIPKSMDREHMIAAVNSVLAGDVFVPVDLTETGGSRLDAWPDDTFRDGYAALTAQQRKVLEMLVSGKSNKLIAYELHVAESTVKAHVSAVLRKLKVTSRTQAVLNASKLLGRVAG